MGKMLERVFCNSITAFIDRSSILNEYQFGCRKGYSAPDALLKLINDIKSKQETNPKTRTSAIMVDIKGAFDNVDHKHLLETLDKKNFPQGTIEWISSFITNRSTAIITDGIVDKTRPTTKGIPQGSPLSPILFNIYTTGLYHRLSEIPGIKFAGFVDDVTIYCHDSQARATNSLGLALKACVEWATKAHTEIDLGDKLNFIHFGNKTANPPRLPVPCQQTLREPQDEAKVLGVILDRKLNFKPHISLKKEQAIQAINFITRLGGTTDGLTGFAFKLLYNSCIVPIISYGVGVWGNNPNTVKKMGNSIQLTQNIALRRMLGAYRTTPIYILHREAGVLPLHIKLEDLARRAAHRLSDPTRTHRDNPTKAQLLSGSVAAEANSRLNSINRIISVNRPRISPAQASKRRALIQWQHEHAIATTKASNSPHQPWYKGTYPNNKVETNNNKLQLRRAMEGPRHILSGAIQLKTGHGRFAKYIAERTKNEENIQNKCPLCEAEPETPKHILTACPCYDFIPTSLRIGNPFHLFTNDLYDIISQVVQTAKLDTQDRFY
ncbi:uncharacterized protein SAPINGB_P002103 [Magnusiomyces paraingens]|uniref:Reverse transcriptase domain-containing protein n=2 Tax=Magnusiomyces paraingens TaxID=2606893 RepID=A0A5E8BDI8_9ASCO|nr:uncharacterized protein SAPINGB_P002103 [Saprochaete ingens]VVT49099.1 unnamed protein product [Saprochaete ingens]